MFAIIVIILVSLLGVLLCSLSEAALYAISRSRIETLRRLRHAGGERLARLRDHVEDPIAAILIVNTAVMTLGAIWSGALVERHYGDFWMGVYSAGFTVAVLFISEIVPKSLGVRFADSVAPAVAWPLQILVWLMWPLVKAASVLTHLFGKTIRISHPTEEDLISMTLLSEAGGKILPQELRWVRNILRLNDIKTRDIMTPYARIKRLPASLPLSKTSADAEHWRYSRVLLAKDDEPDTILGYVPRRSVFAALARRSPETTLRSLMRPVHVVRDDRPSHELVDFFVRHKDQIAVVQNAAGKLVGVVTLEDVLEDMIGAEID
ncbi:MAG: CNNM domain-containing protein [Elusimicrobiota bacterium]